MIRGQKNHTAMWLARVSDVVRERLDYGNGECAQQQFYKISGCAEACIHAGLRTIARTETGVKSLENVPEGVFQSTTDSASPSRKRVRSRSPDVSSAAERTMQPFTSRVIE